MSTVDFTKVFTQTFRDIKREVNKNILKVPEIEQKTLDATSNEPWGPHGSLMTELAQGTRSYNEFQMIMSVLWKRLQDSGKNWRHVYKALTVMEFLLAHGNERVVDDLRQGQNQIKNLQDFQFIEPGGKDQGINVRKKAETLANLLKNTDKIREVRQKAQINKDKYQGISSVGAKSSSFSSYESDRYGDDNRGSKDPYGVYGSSKRDSYGGDRYDDKYGDRFSDKYDDKAGGGNNSRDKYDKYDDGAGDDKYDDRSNRYNRDPREDRYGDESSSTRGGEPTDSYSRVEAGGLMAAVNRKQNERTGTSKLSEPEADDDDFDDFDPRGTGLPAPPAPAPVAQAPPPHPPVTNFFSEGFSPSAPTPATVPQTNDLFGDATFQSAPQAPIDLFATPTAAPPAPSFQSPAVTPFSTSSSFNAFPSTPTVHSTALSPPPFDPFSQSTFPSFTPPVTAQPATIASGWPQASTGQMVPPPPSSGGSLFDSPTNLQSSKPAAVSNAGAKSLEPKSGLWADALSMGLVDLNIGKPKDNPLKDLGIDLLTTYSTSQQLAEKRAEAARVTNSSMNMGKAMGSGTGLGKVGAVGLAPPPVPGMGVNMGMGGMGGGMGGGTGGGMGGGMGAFGGMGMGGMYPGGMAPPMGMNAGYGGSSLGGGMGGPGSGSGYAPTGAPSGQFGNGFR